MKRSPIRRKPRRGLSDYSKAREDLAARVGDMCEARTSACTGALEQVHHRKGRDGVLLADPQYLLGVCAACHRYIHDHPTESYEKGWMLKRNR